MSYNIVNADGTPLATVADGQVNTTSVSLTLIGKNYAGYGTFLNENFLYLLQNFSSPTAPQNPVGGQLWWKSDTRLLNLYDKITQSWKSISGAQSLSSAPLNPVAGDLWFDTVNQQLKTYSGAAWIVIGPAFSASTGTSGAVADTIVDTSLVSHVVVKFYVQNSLVAILNKDSTFTPGTTLSGFPVVKPGFNLAQNFASALAFYDNANNAAYLGGNPASSYVTSPTPTFSGQLLIQNLNGLQVTDSSNNQYFALGASNNNINFVGTAQAYGMSFQTKPAQNNGALINAIVVDKTTGLVSVYSDPGQSSPGTTVATKNYVDSANLYVQGQLTSLTTSLNSGVTTLTANTTLVYGNVRQTQADLGYNVQTYVPSSSGIAVQNGLTHGQAYQQFTASSSVYPTTFAGNLLTLWANVAAFYSNILNNSGIPAGQAGSSMYANVTALQGTFTTLNSQTVQRSGGQTYSMLGSLQPASPAGATFNLGDPGFRFNTLYTSYANIYGYDSSGTILSDSSSPTTGALVVTGGVGVSNNLNVGGKITAANIAGTLGFFGTAIVSGNLYVQGNTTTVNASQVTTNDLLFVSAVNAISAPAAQGAGIATPYSALTWDNATSGWAANVNMSPVTSNTYTLGSSVGPKWWNNIYSSAGTFQTLTVAGSRAVTAANIVITTAAASGGGALSYTPGSGVFTFTPATVTTSVAAASGTAFQLTASGTALTLTPALSPTFSTVTMSTLAGASGAGSVSGTWTLGTGATWQATYADLGEYYRADQPYAPGTVLTIGGTAEVTQENTELSEEVFGIVSTKPAYIMNTPESADAYDVIVAVAGRVPVRVIGAVNKGNRLISAGNGIARAAKRSEWTAFNIIGRALENKNDTTEGIIIAAVNINS
jgi:hypothetical protein